MCYLIGGMSCETGWTHCTIFRFELLWLLWRGSRALIQAVYAFFHHTLNQMQLRNCIFFPWELSKSNYKLQALICICHDTHVNSKPKVWYAFWVKREAVNVLCKHALYTEMDFMPSLWVDYFRDCVVKSSIAWSVDIRFHFEEDDCCNNPPIINSSEL